MTHEELTMKRAEFIQLMVDEFVTRGCAEHVAASYAHGIMSDFEEDEGTTVGDPDYVWGTDGAEGMVQEFIECFDEAGYDDAL